MESKLDEQEKIRLEELKKMEEHLNELKFQFGSFSVQQKIINKYLINLEADLEEKQMKFNEEYSEFQTEINKKYSE